MKFSQVLWHMVIVTCVLVSPASATTLSDFTLEGPPQSAFPSAVAISRGYYIAAAPEYNNSGIVYIFDESGAEATSMSPDYPQPSSYFGSSIAADDSWILVGSYGANNDVGLAYCFDAQTWQKQYIIKPVSNEIPAWFGFSTAICGASERAVIGAPCQSSDCIDMGVDGRAMVYDLTSGTQLSTLATYHNQLSNGFAMTVACSEEYVVVGALQDDVAYIFDFAGNVLLQISAPSGQGQVLQFGASVAITGKSILIGAPGAPSVQTQTNGAGVVYLFDAISGALNISMSPTDGSQGAGFGSAISISGEIAVIGASGFGTSGVQPNSGAAYSFDFEFGIQLEKLVTNADNAQGVGCAVAVVNDQAIVGACPPSIQGQSQSTSAGVFHLNIPMFPSQQFVSSSDPPDGLGYAVAVSESHLIIGAPTYNGSVGAVYVYTLQGQLLHVLTAELPGQFFGAAVASDDNWVWVGAPTANNTRGMVYAYSLSTGALNSSMQAPDTEISAAFGESISWCGEYQQLIIGAPATTSALMQPLGIAGVTYQFDWTTKLLVRNLTAEPSEINNGFGYSTSCYGDHFAVVAPGIGQTYVYSMDGIMLYSLSSSDAAASVTIWESYIMVGALGTVYVRDLWSGDLLHTLTNTDAEDDDLSNFFGFSIMASNQMLLVGAATQAYVYNMYDGTFTLMYTLLSGNDIQIIGGAVAIHENVALIGMGPFTALLQLPGSIVYSFSFPPPPTPPPTPAPTACSPPLPSTPGKPVVSDITSSNAVFAWTPSNSRCAPITGYQVYILIAGNGYQYALTANTTTAQIDSLTPSTFYRVQVAAVNKNGIGARSEASDIFMTKNATTSQYDNTGSDITVYIANQFIHEVAMKLPCNLNMYFSDINQFGSGATCRYLSIDQLEISLAKGTTIIPGSTLNFQSSITHDSFILTTEPPSNPVLISGSLYCPTTVAVCDNFELDASSYISVGASVYGLSYNWTVEEVLLSNGSEDVSVRTSANQYLASLSQDKSLLTIFNGTFPSDSTVTMSVLVENTVFGQQITATCIIQIAHAPIPTISLTPPTTNVEISDRVVIEARVSYSECFLESVGGAYVPSYTWSITGGASTGVSSTVSSDTRSLTIPSFALSATAASSPYVINAKLVGYPSVIATSTISVSASPPVATILGANRQVDVSQGPEVLNASYSYDPNYCDVFEPCTEHLFFSWSCNYQNGSNCRGFSDSALDAVTVDLVEVYNGGLNKTVPDVVVFVQVQVLGVETALLDTFTVKLAITDSGEAAQPPPPPLEPIIPHQFLGYVSTTTSDTGKDVYTYTAIRQLDGTQVDQKEGSTAIFDMDGWPPGEAFTIIVQSKTSTTTSTTVVYTPSTPQPGSFWVEQNGVQTSDVQGLTTTINLNTANFIDDSNNLPLRYQFKDSVQAYSDRSSSIITVDFILAASSTSSRLKNVVAAPGLHKYHVSVTNRYGGKQSQHIFVDASTPYSNTQELFELLATYNSAQLLANVNSVGAFAVAISWVAEEYPDPCNSIVATNMSQVQTTLLSAWLQNFDQATVQVDSATKSLQDMYTITLPGLCVTNEALVWSALNHSLLIFESIAVDKLPSDGCNMTTEIVSACLSVLNIDTGNTFAQVLSYMDSILYSYCGATVFTYDQGDAAHSFVSTGSSASDLSVSSIRAAQGQAIQLDLDGFTIELDEDSAGEVYEQLSTEGSDMSFWDFSGYKIGRDSIDLSQLDGILSDVFEMSIHPGRLPQFRYCNSAPGVTTSNNLCVAKRHSNNSVSNLLHPIRFTLTAQLLPSNASDMTYSCQYVDTATNVFSDTGCTVVEVIEDQEMMTATVTCACNHMTAFAVRQVIFHGTSDCDDLSSEWKTLYGSAGYHGFISLGIVGWSIRSTVLFRWLFITFRTAKKITATLVANSVFFAGSVLRLAYFALLLYEWGDAKNLACVEFDVDGSGAFVNPRAIAAIHDIAEPVLLMGFTAIVLYWYDLEKALQGHIARMVSARFLSRDTLYVFFGINLAILSIFIGVNFGLMWSDSAAFNKDIAAQALLVLFGVVCLLEATAFVWFGRAVVQAGGGAAKMKKVARLLIASSVTFTLLGALNLVFAIPGTISHPVTAFALFSILYHAIEFLGTMMMTEALANSGTSSLLSSALRSLSSTVRNSLWRSGESESYRESFIGNAFRNMRNIFRTHTTSSTDQARPRTWLSVFSSLIPPVFRSSTASVEVVASQIELDKLPRHDMVQSSEEYGIGHDSNLGIQSPESDGSRTSMEISQGLNVNSVEYALNIADDDDGQDLKRTIEGSIA